MVNLGTNAKSRKEIPIARGVMDYFPNAIAAVANVSFVGNQQHNPGEDLHWSREKSNDHADCMARHLIERGSMDKDGIRHSAKLAWRALAILQLEIEAAADSNQYIPGPPGIHADPLFVNQPTDAEKFEAELPLELHSEEIQSTVPLVRNGREVGYFIPEGPFEHVLEVPSPQVIVGMPVHWVGSLGLGPEIDPNEPKLVFMFDPDVCTASQVREFAEAVMAASDGEMVAMPEGVTIKSFTNVNEASETLELLKTVYIAGPMRDYEYWNFPAFDEARDMFISEGWDVISPADIDREAWGGDPLTDPVLFARVTEEVNNWTRADLSKVIKRDIEAICASDAIALLPGWEKSTGAVAEFFIARWLGIAILDATTGRAIEYTPDVRSIMASVIDYIEEFV